MLLQILLLGLCFPISFDGAGKQLIQTGFPCFWKSQGNCLFLENQGNFNEIAEHLKVI